LQPVILNGGKKVTQEIQGRFARVAAANLLDAFDTEIPLAEIARVGQAIGEKRRESPGSSCRESSS
jgi:hypothetical protein